MRAGAALNDELMEALKLFGKKVLPHIRDISWVPGGTATGRETAAQASPLPSTNVRVRRAPGRNFKILPRRLSAEGCHQSTWTGGSNVPF